MVMSNKCHQNKAGEASCRRTMVEAFKSLGHFSSEGRGGGVWNRVMMGPIEMELREL